MLAHLLEERFIFHYLWKIKNISYLISKQIIILITVFSPFLQMINTIYMQYKQVVIELLFFKIEVSIYPNLLKFFIQ